MPDGAVYVGRPTKWGNPFAIGAPHPEHGQAMTRDDAIAFYHRHYAPNNAVLIISGDVTVAKVRELAQKYYGPIKTRKGPPRVRLQEPPQIAARRVTLESDRVRDPRVTRTYLAPSYTTGAKQHAYALQVLDKILSGGATSRFYSTLVVKEEQAVSVGEAIVPGGMEFDGRDIVPFGGDDLRTAYITCSSSGRLLATEWPRPGLELAY